MRWWMLAGLLMAPEDGGDGDGGGAGGGAGGGTGGGGSSSGDGDGDDDLVPRSMLRGVTRERDTWKTRAKTQETEFATQRQTLEQRIAELEAARGEDRALFAAGITDPDGQDVARMLYGRVAQDARPEGGMEAWLKAFKEKPDTAPVPLRPYLTGELGGGDGGSGGNGTQANEQSRVGGENVDAKREREIIDRARKTGDWSEYDRLVRPKYVGKR